MVNNHDVKIVEETAALMIELLFPTIIFIFFRMFIGLFVYICLFIFSFVHSFDILACHFINFFTLLYVVGILSFLFESHVQG